MARMTLRAAVTGALLAGASAAQADEGLPKLEVQWEGFDIRLTGGAAAQGAVFDDDDAATKLIWLALRNITEDWGRAGLNWKAAMNQFAILYEDRFTRPAQNGTR